MTKLEFRDLTPAYGSEVVGFDPHAELDDEACAQLRRAFDERSLLLFRGLDLEAKEQIHLAKLVIGHEGPTSDGSEVDTAEPYFVSNKKAGGGAPYGKLLFHSDMMWADTPFQVLTLYGLEVDEPVVPTMFTSSAHAWDTLPEDLRARVEGMHAVHMTGQRQRGEETEELLQPQRERVQTTTKPVGYAHPRTGRTLLYACQMMTSHIVELSEDESEELLKALFEHLYSSAMTWDHEWREGDLVMWDNLAIQHARPDVSIDGPVRTLRKVIAPKPVLAEKPETPKFTKVN